MSDILVGICHKDLRLRIIRPTLNILGIGPSVAAENLLLGTAAQESLMGHYLHQVEGPAMGIYQMEKATHDDIWENYLSYNSPLVKKIQKMYNREELFKSNKLVYDLKYATIMARIHYFRVPFALPEADDVEALAIYWKRYYNTSMGKGKISDFIENFNRFDIL